MLGGTPGEPGWLVVGTRVALDPGPRQDAGMRPSHVVDARGRSRYELITDEQTAGFVTYTLSEGRVVLRHIEFAEEFRGRGLGPDLARGILDDARDRGIMVVPLCPFIAAWIRRNPSYEDVVDRELLERMRLAPPQ